MSPEIVTIIALVVIFALATFFPINMGALAFVAAFLVGTLSVGAGPGLQPLNDSRIARSMAAASNTPATYMCARVALKLRAWNARTCAMV